MVRRRVAHYALTIFLSAFLLFQVQPLIGKTVLPWFGGTPAVWNTCMVFFQSLLLGGYAYAHWSIAKLSPRRQGLVHLILLVVAVAATAPTIMPGDGWKPTGTESPVGLILLLLTVAVGLPYFTLSATGSLLQAWFARRFPDRSPYPLYALSNAGSLLGLLTFPFLVEPNFGSGAQASGWFWLYALFAFVCSALAIRVGWSAVTGSAKSGETELEPAVAPTRGLRAIWVGLAACGSVMLLATTNQMAIDVASVPFLWVLPLSIYLLSFILCFASEKRYPRVLFYPLFVASVVAVLSLMLAGPGVAIYIQVSVYCGALFVFVMVCHGELYRLRPHPRYLTSFYLMLSLGGALGGVFVGLIAPHVFAQYYELHVCLLLTPALVLYAFWRDPRLEFGRRGLVMVSGTCALVVVAVLGFLAVEYPKKLGYVGYVAVAVTLMTAFGIIYALKTTADRSPLRRGRGRLTWALPGVALCLLGANLVEEVSYRWQGALEISRSFFGMLRVKDRYLEDPDRAERVLYHGAINHGFQFLSPEKEMWHTSYFGAQSGVGLALVRHPKRKEEVPLRVGLLGLGGGTLLTYGKTGDYMRIYEIDPEVERYSRKYFVYFDKTKADTEVVIGDGRLSLEREQPQRFDVLILDAFSSDSIPMHLLTREALASYIRHLEPDGILAFNMSNRHVDIKPVLKQHAEHYGYEFAYVPNWDDDETGVYGASWGLVSNNDAFWDDWVVEELRDESEIDTSIRPWTDDFTNLLAVLKWLHEDAE
jgi:spermidine synthase